ncbi:MAG: tetratricopeptide repeat protein [Gemmatimonadaceae bacterium]
MTSTTRAFLLSFATLLSTTTAEGQGRPALKRGLPVVASRPVCAPAAAARTAAADQRRQARELAQRAQQSAILGDRGAARDQLRQATALDPTNPDLTYQLARAQEAVGATDDATAAYCRFLALAPSAPEAVEARERLAGLTRNSQTGVAEKILAPFRAGVTAYEAGRYAEAEIAFSNAIALQPDWADAYYDRALTKVVRGRREQAIADLQQYLRLRPEAEDRQTVIARINGLRGGPLSPSAALTLGIVIPGAGQMYTGRRVFGVLTLAAAGGALFYALKSGPVTKEFVVKDPKDPFGNPLPSYIDRRTETGHPNIVPGLAAFGAIAGATAIEAFVHARRVNAREQRFGARLVPLADGLALRVTLR